MTTRLAVDTARALAADAVQKVGTVIPVGSDRFVLSVRGRFVIRAKRSPAVPGGQTADTPATELPVIDSARCASRLRSKVVTTHWPDPCHAGPKVASILLSQK